MAAESVEVWAKKEGKLTMADIKATFEWKQKRWVTDKNKTETPGKWISVQKYTIVVHLCGFGRRVRQN